MKRLNSFLIGVVVGAGLLAVATHYHVVHGKDGIFVVRKVQNNLSDIYVDTRDFTPSDWMEHRMLALAIMQADKGEMFSDSSMDGFRDNLRQFVGSWLNGDSSKR